MSVLKEKFSSEQDAAPASTVDAAHATRFADATTGDEIAPTARPGGMQSGMSTPTGTGGWRNRRKHVVGHASSAASAALSRKERKERKAHRQAQELEKGLPAFLRGKVADEQDLENQRDERHGSKRLALSEFIGTFLFLFMAYGIANSASQQSIVSNTAQGTTTAGGLDPSQLLLSSLGFGFSLAVNAWLFFRVSGGLFNPAVTFALLLTGTLTVVRAVILVIVQLAGAIAAAGMAQVLIPAGISVRTRLGAQTTIAQGFFIEFFMTGQLILAVFLMAGEKHKGTFLAPVAIGLALFIAELWATSLTGGSLNPARTLGPDVIAASFDGSSWIYYAAPMSAAIVTSLVYKTFTWLNYQTVVPDQDGDGVHLLMRNAQGQATGYVDQVTEADAPELERMRENQELSRTSTIDPAVSGVAVAGTAGTSAPVAASAVGSQTPPPPPPPPPPPQLPPVPLQAPVASHISALENVGVSPAKAA
ncbi:Aquaporin (major intrinsic protein family) [Ceraceosorus bombacis]|uniref:Aquaporin (Major intrinsic protein family) n=1 Tax=Ceraceosorus bombacis TaxID=401625 RepID=A0A0P1BDD2_9BASI|nr:Aquaporin (major intrinsic protein family) [Ceraceosorus bombacis]